MVTLDQIPAPVSAAGNTVPFRLHTDRQYSSTGARGKIKLTFSGIVTTEDRQLRLFWNGNDITFSTKITDNGDGLTIRTAETGDTLADYLEIVAEDLAKNYLLERDFIVYIADSSSIDIWAKEKGADYDLGYDASSFDECTVSTVTEGTDRERRPWYKLLMKLIEKAPGYTVYGEDLLVPDENGYAIFDMSEYMQQQVETDFRWPVPESGFVFVKNDFCKAFRVQYADMWEGTVKAIYTHSELFRAIPAGLDSYTLNWLDDSFFNLLKTKKIFLTNQPDGKKIRYDQDERLFYLHMTEDTAIKLKIKSYFTNGSTAEHVESLTSIVQYTAYEILVNPARYNFSDYSESGGTDMEKIEVIITTSADVALTETRTYYIDQGYYFNERIFVFKNSLGGWDTLRATGKQEHSAKYSKEELLINSDVPEMAIWNNKMARNYEQNSGNIVLSSREWCDYISELFLSDKVYWIKNGERIPVIITDSSVKKYEDQQFIFDLDFGFKIAWEDSFYSRRFGEKVNETFYMLINDSDEKVITNDSNDNLINQ